MNYYILLFLFVNNGSHKKSTEKSRDFFQCFFCAHQAIDSSVWRVLKICIVPSPVRRG